jgi:hypothetical protein
MLTWNRHLLFILKTNNMKSLNFSEKLNPLWVTGITDSEGNFSINHNKKTNKITFSFKVTQKASSVVILTDLKEFFGCGNINIDNRTNVAYKYVVSNIKDIINIIIPHFDKYPLIGSKNLDYLAFKEAILIFNSKNKDYNKILNIKNTMNNARSFEER